MKRTFTFLMSLFLMIGTMWAQTVDVDMTAKVGTSKEAWNATGGPVTIDGVSMPEVFQQTSTETGDVMWQTVTGLENGKYTVELWANARVAWKESTATDGQEGLTYLIANNVEISMQVFLNPDLNSNKSYVLEDVDVTDGTLKICMTKKAAGSNWHTIQIKSLTYHAPADAALNMAKEELKAALDAANAVSPKKDDFVAAIAAAQNVYDSSESTDDVNAATATLKEATKLAILGNASLENPVLTDFVVNGTFDSDITPWVSTTSAASNKCASNQSGAFTVPFYENWSQNAFTGKMYQVIENVPNGLYELSICAFVNTLDASVQYVYANADKKALVAGEPTAYKVRTVVTDNKIEIGLEQTEAKANWMGIDNVSLTYLGTPSELEIARAEFLVQKDEFDMYASGEYESMYVGKVGEPYYALSEIAWNLAEKEDATVEEYETCIVEMQKVMEDIKTIDAYYVSTFAPLQTECFDVMDNSVAKSEEIAAAFEEAYNKVIYMGLMNVATLEDLQTIVADVDPALCEYKLNALPINGYAFDYTFLLANPSFETGDLTGWTVQSYSKETDVRVDGTAGVDGRYCFNSWWYGVYLTQEAIDIPNGQYRLTVALYGGDPDNDATAYIIANKDTLGVNLRNGNPYTDFSVEADVVENRLHIATVGGNDDDTEEDPLGTFNQNGYWWYRADNFRIYYLGDGGVTGVTLSTEETYIDEWSGDEVVYDLEWEMPNLTEIGQTFKFEVEVEAPEDADKTITWSVSDDKVLSIDNTGLLTVIGSGSGFYEVKATAPNGISASCKVRVEAFREGDITEMEFTQWYIEATAVGQTYQLEVVYNEDATNVDLVWDSTDKSVADVDQNGLVTIVGEGETDIIATAPSGVSASITVYVEILEGGTDGIDNISVGTDAVIYDLSGRRVEKAVKGIYIVNGKKVVK